MACSKSTAPVMYGRSESAGAATQANAVISARQTPVNSPLRMLNGNTLASPSDRGCKRPPITSRYGLRPSLQRRATWQPLAQMDRDCLLRAVAPVGVAEVLDHVEDPGVVVGT